ncbi:MULTISPECIES: hypothetical protein [unclassified Agarivorans]|uniref:hypothetical protein n=1 Tax=unclassified Agarivorans TaxID=2636026 RepID=UPI0026E13714|nr:MULTISPECIES: hypothetical protein [unclassified Agarivorans]MDO6684109.1 hypothetical protein [Agarivorans sp. 3_MG-2023]MDO6714157.1 hypothetical protein [Agarivorans sp. 2_MG-2023]
MSSIQIQLEDIFEFLKANRDFNLRLQEQFFLPVLCVDGSVNPKVINLLYHVANTQSQPKIDLLAEFYKTVYRNVEKTESFASFVELLTGKESLLFSYLYKGLRAKKGWGDKTAALFTKVVYQAHNKLSENCHFWADTPKHISKGDEIWLPVDAVIIHIFKQLGMDKPNFSKINKLIKQYYKGSDLEVWDDLWFWGFITQKGTGNTRKTEWNENKYWSLTHSDKTPSVIRKIKEKSIEFIGLLEKQI